MRTGISKEEVVQLAASATDKHKLCAVTVFKEEDGRIGVLLATAISDTGGVIIYFKHSAAGWIEDDSEIGMWDEKRRANKSLQGTEGKVPSSLTESEALRP